MKLPKPSHRKQLFPTSPFKHIKASLTQKFVPSSNFWSISDDDLIPFVIAIFSTIVVWINASLLSPNGFYQVPCYWDGPNYIYVALSLYNIPDIYPWFTAFKYKPSYFACHLPGFPLVIKMFSFLFLGDFILGNFAAILFSITLFAYSFRRLLVAFACVRDPEYTTCIALVFPPRFLLYHSVGSSEPLFISCACLAFIFFKMKKPLMSLIFVWYCCITRVEGIAIGATIGFSFLISFQFKNACLMFGTFISTVFLICLHKIKFNDYLAYIHFNKDQARIIQHVPFLDIVYHSGEQYTTHPNTLCMFH